MGKFHDVQGMFRAVNYNQFTTAQIREKMREKISSVSHKIDERKSRVTKLREENGITDSVLNDILTQYIADKEKGQRPQVYSTSNKLAQSSSGSSSKEVLIAAGVIAALLEESGLIESEQGEIKRMQLILRNIKDQLFAYHPQTGQTIARDSVHALTDDEIEYLGF